MTDTYHLAYSTTAPALTDHDIKQRATRPFFDREFTFTVIGDSHYIGCAEAGYHELLTCNPRGGSGTAGATDWDREGLRKTVPLTVGHEERLRHVLDGVGIETEISGEPLAAVDAPESFDIAYRFGPNAYTTIDLLAADTYETYHTYPEYDLALRTETRLVQL